MIELETNGRVQINRDLNTIYNQLEILELMIDIERRSSDSTVCCNQRQAKQLNQIEAKYQSSKKMTSGRMLGKQIFNQLMPLFDVLHELKKIQASVGQIGKFKKEDKERYDSCLMQVQRQVDSKKIPEDNELFTLIQSVALTFNLHDKTDCPLLIDSPPFIRKLERALDQLVMDQDDSEQFIIFERPKGRNIRERRVSSFLYLIVIFICKSQRSNGAPYKKFLKKFFKKRNVERILEIGDVSPSNSRFEIAVLGNMANFYKSKKTDQKIVEKIRDSYISATHEKTIFYATNFLREKWAELKYDQEQGLKLIEKTKSLIKQYPNKFQVASVIDLYVNLPVKVPELKSQFYDEEILEQVTDREVLQAIKFPAVCHKSMLYKGVAKILTGYMETEGFSENHNAHNWCYRKAIQFLKLFRSEKQCRQQVFKLIEILVSNISIEAWMQLQSEHSLIDTIFSMTEEMSFKIRNCSLRILEKISKSMRGSGLWTVKRQFSERLQKVDQELLCNFLDDSDSEKAANLRFMLTYIPKEEEMDLE